jgi:hypothetical protein
MLHGGQVWLVCCWRGNEHVRTGYTMHKQVCGSPMNVFGVVGIKQCKGWSAEDSAKSGEHQCSRACGPMHASLCIMCVCLHARTTHQGL